VYICVYFSHTCLIRYYCLYYCLYYSLCVAAARSGPGGNKKRIIPQSTIPGTPPPALLRTVTQLSQATRSQSSRKKQINADGHTEAGYSLSTTRTSALREMRYAAESGRWGRSTLSATGGGTLPCVASCTFAHVCA
jgi:hypothetical protein